MLTIEAKNLVNLTVYGRSKNSLGPWALALGPKAPETRILAFGKALAKQPTTGIAPPSANENALVPKTYWADVWIACSNQA